MSGQKCCTTDLPPFPSDYTPIGKTEKIGNVDVYVTGSGKKAGIICTMDIFGMLPNTMKGADILANRLNARVYVPDFFHGKPWDPDNFPPKEGMDPLVKWVSEAAPPDTVKTIYTSIIEHAEADNISSETICGYAFCWGAKQLVTNARLFKSIAVVHPAFLSADDAKNVHVPTALLPSKDEDPDTMKQFWSTLPESIKEKSCFKTFAFHHGFAASRSNWEDKELGAAAHEAYEIVAGLFEKNILSSS